MTPLVRSALDLPFRPAKPRATGITMVIDNGLPTGAFRDYVASTAELIDVVQVRLPGQRSAVGFEEHVLEEM